MACRKWLVRGLVFSVVGGLGVAASLYQGLTNPATIRRLVIDQLQARAPGAVITLNAARLTLLGGIAVDELRLAREDDLDRFAFMHVPSAVIYHDKEQLLDGKLVIRKLELHRPRLHLIRGKDGRWNFLGLYAKPRPDVSIPVIVVRHGTLLIEDFLNSPAAAAVEIKDVNLTLLNDPLPQVTFRVCAASDLLGRLSVIGSWQRQTEAVALSVEATTIPVQPSLIHWLSAYVPQLAEHARQVTGTGAVQATLNYQMGSARPWSHNVRVQLAGGKVCHAKIPVPLEQVDACVHCFDGEIRLERCTARAGPSRLELTGWARPRDHAASAGLGAGWLTGSDDFEGDLSIEHLEVNSPLFAPLPQKLKKLNEEYSPTGLLNATCHISRIAGKWKQLCRAQLLGVSAAYYRFPYRINGLTGTLVHEIDPAQPHDHFAVDLKGNAGATPVFIKGTVTGEGPKAAVDIKVWGDDLAIDRKLDAALPKETKALADKFHPAGRLNFQAVIHRDAGGHPFHNRYLIYFHDATVRYDVFPYPLEQVRGWLDVRPERWDFHDFEGTHKGGTFRARGHSQKEHLTVEIRGDNAVLDEELETALRDGGHQELGKAWQVFNPSGRMNFVAQIERPPKEAIKADVTLTALNCGLKPQFFPYPLRELSGTIRYVEHWVYAEKLRARNGSTVFMIDDAKAYLKPKGGCWVDVKYLRAKPVVLDSELLKALPEGLQKVCAALQVKEPLELQTWFRVDSAPDDRNEPVLFWDGDLSLRDATVQVGVPLSHVAGKVGCRGRYDGRKLDGLVGHFDLDRVTVLQQPFQRVYGKFEVQRDKPDVLLLPDLTGYLFGGKVHGHGRLDFGSAMRYELKMSAEHVRLEDFARHNLGPSAPVSGLAMADLYLSGQGNDLENLRGNGTIDVPSGRMYNLPVLLDLLKILGLRLPDGTAFEEAHAKFTVEGPRVRVDRIDLYGSSISLRGQGEVKGTDVRLDFYAVWSRITAYLPPIIKEIPPALSQNLWKIKLRGRPGEFRCTQEPVPILVEPVKDFVRAVAGRRGRETRVERGVKSP